jgi:hypothetical protein
LTGTVPKDLGSLRLLAGMKMSNNSLAGSLPDDLFVNLGTLSSVDLSNNDLTGTIPSTIADSVTVSIHVG